MFELDGEITPMNILLKIKSFSMHVKSYNKTGYVTGISIFHNCRFTNLVEDFTNFSYTSYDILSPDFNFEYESNEYITASGIANFKRRMKLERILR